MMEPVYRIWNLEKIRITFYPDDANLLKEIGAILTA